VGKVGKKQGEMQRVANVAAFHINEVLTDSARSILVLLKPQKNNNRTATTNHISSDHYNQRQPQLNQRH